MTSDEFGRLGFAFSAATFLAIFASFGHFTLLLRFVPVYLEHQDRVKLRQLLVYSLRTVALGIAGTALMVVLATCISSGTQEFAYASVTALLVLAFVMADYTLNLLRSIGGVVNAIAPRVLVWRVAMVAIAGACLWMSIELDAESGVSLLAISLITIASLQALVALGKVRRFTNKPSAEVDTDDSPELDQFDVTLVDQWRRSARWFWGVAVTQATMQNIGVVIVGLILTAAETGKFFVVVKIAMVLGMPLMAVSVVIPPLISKHYAAKQYSSIQTLSSSMAGIASLLILIGVLILVFIGDTVIAQFNENYRDGYLALLIACSGILIDACFGPTGFIMLMTGHEKRFLAFVAGSNIIALIALCILTTMFGVVGAATSLLLGSVMWNSLTWYWSRKHLGIDPTILGLIPALRPEPRLQ
ncbi:lipopolysaccharide biosynthesis protein [Rubripirellula obstinata]|nr:polysaccharide biosynthesis C-terminal domain-containing protein [Rubripirellula obstinata]